jgi:hypothetical protein
MILIGIIIISRQERLVSNTSASISTTPITKSTDLCRHASKYLSSGKAPDSHPCQWYAEHMVGKRLNKSLSGRDNLYHCQDLLSQPPSCTDLILSILNEQLQTQPNTFVQGHWASELGLHIGTAPYKPCRLEIGGTAKHPAIACMHSILSITKQRGSIAPVSRLKCCRSGKACTWHNTGKAGYWSI